MQDRTMIYAIYYIGIALTTEIQQWTNSYLFIDFQTFFTAPVEPALL